MLSFKTLNYINFYRDKSLVIKIDFKSASCMTGSSWQVRIVLWLSVYSGFSLQSECLRPSTQAGLRMEHSLPVVPRAYVAVRPG